MRPLLVALALAACGPPDAPAEARGEAVPSEARAELASEPEGAGCTGSLRDETPEALRRALSALGWSTVYDDACAAEAARASGDPAACDALSVSALREHCRDEVAIATGQPLACSEGDHGHEPLCLALAARHRGLCRSVPLARRALCEALLGDGVDRCDRADVPDHEGCRRGFEERATLFPVPSTAARTPSLEVALETTRVIELGTQHTREAPVTEDLSEAERGAVLRWDGCNAILTLGSATAEPLSRRTQLFVEVRLPAHMDTAIETPLGERAQAAVERTTFGRAEGGAFFGGSGSVRVEPFEASLGAEVRLTLSGRLTRHPGFVEVELRARTVLRDVLGVRGTDCAEVVP